MSTDGEPVSFPLRRTCPFALPAEYARLRDEDPVPRAVLPTGRTTRLVTRHADVREALSHPLVSPDRNRPGFPLPAAFPPETLRKLNLSLLGMDPPGHTWLRRLVISEFTHKRMKALRPHVQAIVDRCVDDVLASGPPVDLVQALSLPVPSLTVCELLGVPYADHEFFQSRATTMVNRDADLTERTRANAEFVSYVDGLVTDKEPAPPDDLIGRLINRMRAADRYDHETVVALARLLLIAGHESTANMISLSAVALLEHPELLTELENEPDLAPRAVEELLRFFSVSDVVTARAVLDDIEIGGVTIRRDEGLIALTAAANRDEAVFDSPDRLDFHRDSRSHLAFGFGVHQCLGQNLARVELEVVLTTL
ncbi:cytochrome P450 [Actinosynnema sp. NPDC023658]|uniref:cytochrome P450 n=1 Tax=Actinosynnema sp. NPDC023658 TaxID=3155465 RepID=UPI0033D54D55